MQQQNDLYPSRINDKDDIIWRTEPLLYPSDIDPAEHLTADLLQHYQEKGYMLIPELFNDKEVNAFISELERMKQEYGVPSDQSLSYLASKYGIDCAEAKAGSVLFFDCNVMHGSNSNITPCPRSNLFFAYNQINNRVGDPFCGKTPRPEYLCSRQTTMPI